MLPKLGHLCDQVVSAIVPENTQKRMYAKFRRSVPRHNTRLRGKGDGRKNNRHQSAPAIEGLGGSGAIQEDSSGAPRSYSAEHPRTSRTVAKERLKDFGSIRTPTDRARKEGPVPLEVASPALWKAQV